MILIGSGEHLALYAPLLMVNVVGRAELGIP